jgi:hypothetical protein
MLRKVLFITTLLTAIINAKSLEPYGDYLIVLVHGIYTNPKFDKSICIPCQSAADCDSVKQRTIDTLRMETGLMSSDFGVCIFKNVNLVIDSMVNGAGYVEYDTTYDTSGSVCYTKTVIEEDKRPSNLFDPGEDAIDMDFGDLKGYLENDLGMQGHVYSYNFTRPAETYYSFDTAKSTMFLARQLGDRDTGFSFETGDYKLFPTYHPNLDSNGNWFYQNETKRENVTVLPNRGTVTDLCWLEKALEDWKWYYVNKDPTDAIDSIHQIPDSLYPRKYLLVAQSMGGLSSRGYIVSKFYKNDVDKLVTIDSPHEGSDIITMIKNYAKMRDGDYYKNQLLAMIAKMAIGDPNSTQLLGSWVWQAIWDKIYGELFKATMTGYDGNESGVNNLLPTSDFICRYNNTLPIDSNAHIPMFRLIMTTGTPTIETELTNAMFFLNKYSFLKNSFAQHGNSSYLLPMLGTNWKDFSSFDKYWAMVNAGVINDETGTALGIPALTNGKLTAAVRFPALCVLGQWGDVFVPEWSQQANNIALFKIGDTKKWKMNTKKIHDRHNAYLNKIDNVCTAWNVLFNVTNVAGILLPREVCNTLQTTLAWGQLYTILPWCISDISAHGPKRSAVLKYALGPHGVCVEAVHKPVQVTKLLTTSGETVDIDYKTDDTKYVEAPYRSENISGNRIIDEALWERPVVSIKEITSMDSTTLRIGRDSANVLLDATRNKLFWDAGRKYARSKYEADNNEIKPEQLESYTEMPLRFRNSETGDVHYYNMPLLSVTPQNLPAKLQFIIDDLNPQVARVLSFSVNGIIKTFKDSTSRWTSPFNDSDIKAYPVDAQGLLTVEIKDPANFFSTSGLNTISISVKNRIGFMTTRSFTFNTVELAPQITDVFPYRNSVVSFKPVSPFDTNRAIHFRIMVPNNDPVIPTVNRIYSASLTYDSMGIRKGLIISDTAIIRRQFSVDSISVYTERYYKVIWHIPASCSIPDNHKYQAAVRINHGNSPSDTSDVLYAAWSFYCDETSPVSNCVNSIRNFTTDSLLNRNELRIPFNITINDNGWGAPWLVFENNDGVYNAGGTLVKRLRAPGNQNLIRLQNKSTVLQWDGTLDNGTKAPDGVYHIRCHALDESRRYSGDYDPSWVTGSPSAAPIDNILLAAGRKMWDG